MRCFTHPQTEAVAQCSQCQKGICTICATNITTNIEGATLCPSCCETGLREEIAHAQRSIVGVWVFTGVITAITAIAVFGSIAQAGAGAGAILFIPLLFAASWCLFWGWSPIWNGFRRAFAGWGCAGTWLFMLIVTVLISEILIGIAILVGAFSGIKKYTDARRLVANGSRMIAELHGMPTQQQP